MNWRSILVAVLFGVAAVPTMAQGVREPAVAGTFYSADSARLAATVTGFLHAASIVNMPGEIRAILAPHAGYVYSGAVAAEAYRAVLDCGQHFDAVLVIAPSHRHPLKGVSVAPYAAYHTPLGSVAVHRALSEAIVRRCDAATAVKAAHVREHAVEVQLPFIQTVLPGVPIVALTVGQVTETAHRALVNDIIAAIGSRNVLIVASSDLSHFPCSRDAVKIDGAVMHAVGRFDMIALERLHRLIGFEDVPGLSCALCGWPALKLVMALSKRLHAAEAKVLMYAHSGDVTGDLKRVVGYGSAVFYQPKEERRVEEMQLTKQEKKRLFEIGRSAMQSALEMKSLPEFEVKEPALNAKCGVFVTLTNEGFLRGCIGTFSEGQPLWQAVRDMAVAAATQDYRFAANPVTLDELAHIDVKISILSQRRLIKQIDEIQVGLHGVWVEMHGRSGTYLPEVAVEQGWNRIQLLEHLCAEKSGLPRDAYKKGAKIYIYTSQILSEGK